MAVRISYAGVLLIMIGLFISGCAHTISSELRAAAVEGLDFPTVLENPTAYVGKTVIWGGILLKVINRPDGTELIVLETPLEYEERPMDREYSRGRFIAETHGYLDPEVYQEGMKVTVAGEIVGQETRPLGDTRYTYPVLQVRELHLWKKQAYRAPYYYDPYFRWNYGYGWPYYYYWPRYGLYYPYW
jgi:outer membrane lipoprotein